MSRSTEHVVVVTGANGFVGSRVCAALARQGVRVRAVVRRPGTAPELDGVDERVGDFGDADFAATLMPGAATVVTTIHPMGSDARTQRRVGVEGTAVAARAAAGAGVERLVHLSTAAVYDRSPGVGDVDEGSALVGDDAGDYAVTKRDTDAALAAVPGLTRILLRPPSILGTGETSVWNTLRPAAFRDHEAERHAVAEQSFAWVHVDDLVSFATELATAGPSAVTDAEWGPVEGGCTAVNVAAGAVPARRYFETLGRALGADPVWEDRPAWTGRILAERAHRWGWRPAVDLDRALEELEVGLRDSR